MAETQRRAVAGSAGIGAVAGLGVGIAYGVFETQKLFGGTLVPFFPGWVGRVLQAPDWTVAMVLGSVFLLVCGLGWTVVAITRPADRATALAAGLLTGLTAGFATFVTTGPIQVIRAQLELQARHNNEARALNRFEEPQPQVWSQPAPQNYRPTPEQFTGAFAGVWLGLFRTTLPFAVFGAFTAWAADHLRRTHGNRWRVLVPYLQMTLGALMLGSIVGLIGNYLIADAVLSDSRVMESYGHFRIVGVFGGPLALTALAIAGVLRGWRWWWRLLGDSGWLMVLVLYFALFLD